MTLNKLTFYWDDEQTTMYLRTVMSHSAPDEGQGAAAYAFADIPTLPADLRPVIIERIFIH